MGSYCVGVVPVVREKRSVLTNGGELLLIEHLLADLGALALPPCCLAV
jgi:hypothetical protein